MSDDSFVCKKCGDILRDPMIATYRAVISSGGSVRGSIRCGRCGSVYTAEQVVGVSTVGFKRQSKKKEMPQEQRIIMAICIFLGIVLFFISWGIFFKNAKDSLWASSGMGVMTCIILWFVINFIVAVYKNFYYKIKKWRSKKSET
jgi:hypothetical protein